MLFQRATAHPLGLNLNVISVEKAFSTFQNTFYYIFPCTLHFLLLALFLIMTVLNTFVAIYCMSVSFTRIWASWEQGVYVYHSSNHLAWCLARGRCWAVFVELVNECMFDKRVWGICEELKEVQQGWCLIPRRRVVRDKAGLLDWSYLLFYPFLLFSTKFNFPLICLLDQIFNNVNYSTNYICKHLLKHHCKVR